jgi:hypothetical protein
MQSGLGVVVLARQYLDAFFGDGMGFSKNERRLLFLCRLNIKVNIKPLYCQDQRVCLVPYRPETAY